MNQSSSSTASATTPPSAAFLAGAEAARNAIMVQNLRPAEITRNMFTHVDNNLYRCNICEGRYKASNGPTNLMNHLTKSHARTWEGRMAEEMAKLRCIDDEFISVNRCTDSSRNQLDWLDLIVMNDLPLYYCENAQFRKHTKLHPTTVKTLMRSMRRMYRGLIVRIAEVLPTNFGLLHDGWSTGNGFHVLGVMATYYSQANDCAESMLIGLNKLADPTNQNAANHRDSIHELMEKYNRTSQNVLFLVSDSASVNRSLSRLMGVPMVNCRCHFLSLAIKHFVKPFKALLAKDHAVLVKIRGCSNIRNKLKRRTDVTATISPEHR